MSEALRPRVKYVIGPDGSPLTIADLPPTSTKRWVIRRKAEVVAAVRGGLISLEEACSRYTLTVDEFLSWQASHDPHPAISPLSDKAALVTRSASASGAQAPPIVSLPRRGRGRRPRLQGRRV